MHKKTFGAQIQNYELFCSSRSTSLWNKKVGGKFWKSEGLSLQSTCCIELLRIWKKKTKQQQQPNECETDCSAASLFQMEKWVLGKSKRKELNLLYEDHDAILNFQHNGHTSINIKQSLVNKQINCFSPLVIPNVKKWVLRKDRKRKELSLLYEL